MSGPEVPVAGVVEAVDAAFGVDGEDGLLVGFGAEGGEAGFEGAAEVAEAAGRGAVRRGGRCAGGGGRCGGRVRGVVMWRPPNSAHASTAAEDVGAVGRGRCGRAGRRPSARPASCPSGPVASRLRGGRRRRNGKRVVLRSGHGGAVSRSGGWGRRGVRRSGRGGRRRCGRAGRSCRGGVAVLADAACGDLGVFEGAACFAGCELSCGRVLERLSSVAVRCRERRDGFGAAAGEAFALVGGEGVEEVLDERVQGGRVVAACGGAGEGLAADGEGGADGGEYAVAAVAQGGRPVGGGAPGEARVAACGGRACRARRRVRWWPAVGAGRAVCMVRGDPLCNPRVAWTACQMR